MSAVSSDFLPPEALASDLSAWAAILSPGYRLLAANLFADFFLSDEAGVIYMLELSPRTVTAIAASEAEFRERLVEDSEGWLLRPLADRCREAGMNPQPDDCYAFTTLPVFGGLYEVDNIFLCPWREWISFSADIYCQIKDLPDGGQVEIRVVD
jgi:hypothetical protein